MRTIEISDKKRLELDKFKTDSSNNESQLYYLDKNTLLKRLLPNLASKRRRAITYLGEYKNPNCVLPKEIYVDENGYFRGYTMEYLKKYKVIGARTIGTKLSFDRRMALAKSVYSIINQLENDGIAYYDVHSDNFMVNAACNVKLIDIDSSTVRSIKGDEEFITDIDFSHLHTAQLCMSLLYGIDDADYRSIMPIAYQAMLLKCNDKQKKLMTFLKNKQASCAHPEDYLEYIDEKFIQDTKPFVDLVLK